MNALFIVAFQQRLGGVALYHCREFPAEVIDILNAAIAATCPERRDHMGAVACKNDAAVYKTFQPAALERIN